MRMYAPYQIGRRQVRAHLAKPAKSPRTLAPVRHMVHFPRGTVVQPGEVLMQDGRPVVLLAEHHETRDAQVLLGLKITGQLPLLRSQTVVDPVTKMAASPTFAAPESVYVVEEVFDPDQFGNQQAARRVFYTGTEVALNDKLGGLFVRGVVKVLGIYRAEVSA
jgi:hypothetical protein